MSELLFRYPHASEIGFNGFGLILTLIVGGFIGFSLPVGLANSPKIHKGFTLYSAALPMGMTAFFLNAALFKTTGFELPELAYGQKRMIISQGSITVRVVRCLL